MGFDAGSIESRLTIDATEFDAKLDVVEARGKALEDKKLNVKVDADTAEATVKLAAVDEQMKAVDRDSRSASTGISSFGGGIGLLGTSIALALPLLPELAAGVVALGGVAAAAGAGLGAFGAIALTDITKATSATKELQSAQTAVDNATTPQGRTDALIKQKALIDSLGPSTIALGQAVSGLTGAWSSFAAGFTPELTRDVAAVTGLLTDAFPLIQPLITAGAGAVSTILSNLDTALRSPEAKQFFAWIAGTAEQDILGLANAFGGFAGGVLELFRDFAPLETLVVNGLSGMGSAFSTWAAHLPQTQGFQQFLAYAIANGPLLIHTLGDLGSAFGHVLQSLQPLLPPLLKIIDFLAQVVSGAPPGIIQIAALAAVITLVGGAATSALGKLLLIPAAEDAVGASAVAASGKASGLLLALRGLAGLGLITVSIGLVISQLSGGDNFGIGNTNLDNLSPDQRTAFLKSLPGGVGKKLLAQLAAEPGFDTSSAAAYLGFSSTSGTQADSAASAADLAAAQGNSSTGGSDVYGNSTFNSQVPGTIGSYFGNTGATGGAPGGGTGNPPAYKLPQTPGAGAGAAANNAAGLAALLGLNLMQSLAQGIATGTNPLTQAFQNINLQLTGPAQTLGTQLQTIFSNALQLGQQAAASLAFSVTAAPTVGSYTSITSNGHGGLTSTVQSQLVGSSFNQLFMDQKFVADIGKARSLGLAPSLLQQFVTAGPSSFSVLDALVNGGASTVSQLNAENSQITALGNSYGLSVAGNSVEQQELSVLQQIRDLLGKAPAAHAAAVAPATGRAVGAAISKTAAAGARTAVKRPSLGAAASTVNGRRFN